MSGQELLSTLSMPNLVREKLGRNLFSQPFRWTCSLGAVVMETFAQDVLHDVTVLLAGLEAMKRGQAPKADPAFEQAWSSERSGTFSAWRPMIDKCASV